MKTRLLVVASVALLVSGIVAAAEPPIAANAEAGQGTVMSATLAPYGSFEFIAAPSYTKLASIRASAASALRNRQITAAQAQDIQKRADVVRSLLDQAVKTCAQDNRKGFCRGDSVKANVLLTEANAKLAALQ